MKPQANPLPKPAVIHPHPPLLDSTKLTRPRAAELLTFHFFKESVYEVEEQIFTDHIIVLNPGKPYQVERWLDGIYHNYIHGTEQVSIIPAGSRYRGKWSDAPGIFVITLETDKLKQFAQNELAVLLNKRQLNPQPQPHSTDPNLCGIAEMMKDALTDKAVGSELLFETLAKAFLIKTIREYGKIEKGVLFSSSFTAESYSRLLKYIEKQYPFTITVEDMANVSLMSISHFSRQFKKVTGQSPLSFVMSYRVEQAKKKLAENIAYADIAQQCGFTDQSHFNRVFKKHNGITPKEYRATQQA